MRVIFDNQLGFRNVCRSVAVPSADHAERTTMCVSGSPAGAGIVAPLLHAGARW